MWQMIKLHLENVENTSNLHEKPPENSMKHNYQTYQIITPICNSFHNKCTSIDVNESTSANWNLNTISIR